MPVAYVEVLKYFCVYLLIVNHLIQFTMSNQFFDIEREQARLRAENRRSTIQSYLIGMGVILTGFAYSFLMLHFLA